MQNPKTLSDTHLNICAVMSQLDNHQDALQHAMLSIILLQDQVLQSSLYKNIQKQNLNQERLVILAIAYHNLGVQFEHLKRFQEALKLYKKSLDFSKSFLSDNEELIQNLQKVVKSANYQIKGQKNRLINNFKYKFNRDIKQAKKQLYKGINNFIPKINKKYAKNNNQENCISIQNHYSTNTKKIKQMKNLSQMKGKIYKSISTNPANQKIILNRQVSQLKQKYNNISQQNMKNLKTLDNQKLSIKIQSLKKLQ